LVGRRTAAVAVGAVNGIWSILLGEYWRAMVEPICPGSGYVGLCVLPPTSNLLVLALSALVLVVSLVCYFGWTVTFYGSAVLSAVALAAELLSGVGLGWATILSVALGIATIALDVAAARTKTGVAEENHPLNLPVFG